MTTTTMIIIGVAVVILVAVAFSRSGGPRVTTIERKTEERDDA